MITEGLMNDTHQMASKICYLTVKILLMLANMVSNLFIDKTL